MDYQNIFAIVYLLVMSNLLVFVAISLLRRKFADAVAYLVAALFAYIGLNSSILSMYPGNW